MSPKLLALCLLLAAGAAWPQKITMDTRPQAFTPGGAVGGKLRVKWTVQQQAGVLLQLVDAAGRCARTLDAGNMAPGDYSVLFDGRDAAGNLLPAGAYTLRLSATPTASADRAFGVNGMLGQSSRTFTFEKATRFELDAKGIDPALVTVKVDGEPWAREETLEVAGNTFLVDAVAGAVELNPTGTLDRGSEIVVSCALGLPLENPFAVQTAPDGSLFIADNLFGLDTTNKKAKPRTGFVYKVDAAGRPAADFAKNGVLTATARDLAVDRDGNLYLVPVYHEIPVYDARGTFRYSVGGYIDPAKVDKAHPHGGYWPQGIAVNAAKRLLICNGDQTNVLYDATNADFAGYLACEGAAQGADMPPIHGPCAAAWGDTFYTTTYYCRLMKHRYDPATGELAVVWSTPALTAGPDTTLSGPAQLWFPMGLAADGTGLIYVADHQNHRVQIFFDAGAGWKHVGSLGSAGSSVEQCQLGGPHAVCLSPDGASLYVADDGLVVPSGNTPAVRGLARVVKWTLGAAETLEARLTIK